MIENEVLLTSCKRSEPSPLTPPENESQGNVHDAKLNCLCYKIIVLIVLMKRRVV